MLVYAVYRFHSRRKLIKESNLEIPLDDCLGTARVITPTPKEYSCIALDSANLLFSQVRRSWRRS